MYSKPTIIHDLAFYGVLMGGCVAIIALLIANKSDSPRLLDSIQTIYRNKDAFLLYNLTLGLGLTLLITVTDSLLLGSLNETEQGTYNETAMEFLGNAFMTGVSFPYTLTISSFLPFVLLYNLLGTAWQFKLNLHNRSFRRNCWAYGALSCFIAYKLQRYVNKFALMFMSLNGLLAYEYFMALFYITRHFMLYLCNDISPCVLFGINTAYLLCRIGVTAYYANSLMKFRMPITYLKLIAVDMQKLRKKIRVFYNYVNLVYKLESVPDAVVNLSCAICTDNMETGKQLGCSHTFHLDCLKMWCERESTCPICRKPMSTEATVEIETENEVIQAVPM